MCVVWAVHVLDNILLDSWWIGGFVVVALLALLAAWRIRDEEIPHIALLTAAFFAASSIPLKLGPGSAHLLLNGLLGVILGRRVSLAILIGVSLQSVLLQHGGNTTIGINACIMILPALLAWAMFAGLQRLPWLKERWFRGGLVALSVLVWILSAVYGVALVVGRFAMSMTDREALLDWANQVTFHPITLAAIIALTGLVAWVESRLENAPEFPVGLLIGETAVLATALLNYLVLLWGGRENWHEVALIIFVIHLPVAAVEGIVVGFTVGFLARVKPEMLGWKPLEKSKCLAD